MPRKKTVKRPRKKAKKKARKVNPIDAALSSKEKLAAQRHAEDLQVWQAWKQNPTQQNMHALNRRFEPVFRAKVNQFKAPNVNTAAFRGNLKLHAVRAYETYDPSRAALRTHLDNQLQQVLQSHPG